MPQHSSDLWRGSSGFPDPRPARISVTISLLPSLRDDVDNSIVNLPEIRYIIEKGGAPIVAWSLMHFYHEHSLAGLRTFSGAGE